MGSDLGGKTRYVFTWNIENFRACTRKTGVSLDSPIFIVESSMWFVKLYPCGSTGATKKFISCFLNRASNCAGPDEVECDYTLEAFDRNNKSLANRQYFNKFRKGDGYGALNFFINDSNLNICSFDTLVVKVSLENRLRNNLTKKSGWSKIVSDHHSFIWNLKYSESALPYIRRVPFTDNLLFEIVIEIPEDDVKISLWRKTGFTESHVAICTVTLIDLKGENGECREIIFEADAPHEEDTWNFPTFLKLSKIAEEKDKYLDDNCFTLKFDFCVSDGKTLESTTQIEQDEHLLLVKTKEYHLFSLGKHLKQMFNNNVHTDVELRGGGSDKGIRAHKVILCATSQVFSAMFDQDMTEKQTGVIHIDDVEAGTLNSLLEFMYNGDTELLDYESALKLLLAADKYQVLALKELCSSSLESFMSDKNVCDILFTADLVQQSTLKVCAVNHIKEHSKKIFKSDEWKLLAERSLKLATETFCEVSTLSG